MTLAKEEVEDKIELILDSDTGSDCTVLIDELLAHDAEQRQVIEGLSAKVKNLTAWSDRMFGTPCAEIRHQQQVEMLEEKIKQQAQEIATLREALQGILEIGKRDMTNPKYDGYFEQAQQALKASYSERKKNG